MDKYKSSKLIINIAILGVIAALLFWGQDNLTRFQIRLLNLSAIYVILSLSMNLVIGFTGMFSLGHAGFMCIGSYTAAILTMTPESKQLVYYMEPIVPWLANIHWPIVPAIIMAGIVAAIFGFLVGFPALRLKDDYLAIATLGFAEILRIIITNTITITNGSLGLKNIPSVKSLWVYWGCALLTIYILKALINSSWGQAFKAIRDNEIAAEAMGISLFKHKIMSFTIGAFFAGIAGALMAFLITSIDPTMYRFLFTYQILLIVVLGGMGSLTGSVIAGIFITIATEWLRIVERDMFIFGLHIAGIPGMRMVIFALLLLGVILFYRQGLMGTKEFSIDWILHKLRIKKSTAGGA
ncbi:branched-chain amino acid ABC transporter permease [Bacillota bacterium LX-D]|nr:branched-chain amino acid ABC transporter permease [Bacillota bacterium LX-D]